MITFENVSKEYPYHGFALQNVSFSVAQGEFVFLVGHSGAGKSTILKLLTRQILPTAGQVTLENVDIGSPKYTDLVKLRQKIGIIFQDFKILPDKTVFENVALALAVSEHSPALIEAEVMKALTQVKLAQKKAQFPAQLSAGELQRVAIARAVVGDRRIILADEPTGNLDPKTSWEIFKIFTELAKTRTILIATHNTDIVESMQKRVLYMSHGVLERDQKEGGYFK